MMRNGQTKLLNSAWNMQYNIVTRGKVKCMPQTKCVVEGEGDGEGGGKKGLGGRGGSGQAITNVLYELLMHLSTIG